MASGPLGVVPYAVNFSVVVVGVYFLTRKPLQKFLFQRHERIRDSVEGAEKDLRIATERLNKVQGSLSSFKELSENIWSQERLSARQETASIQEKTQAELVRIEADGFRVIENESRERDAMVRGNFVDLIAKQAEEKLQKNLRREDHVGLIKRASLTIEAKT